MTALAPAQLPLPFVAPPGICRVEFCGNRISVANLDGICDQCKAAPLPEYAAFTCCVCGVNAVRAYKSKCWLCRAGGDRDMVNARKRQRRMAERQQRRQAAR